MDDRIICFLPEMSTHYVSYQDGRLVSRRTWPPMSFLELMAWSVNLKSLSTVYPQEGKRGSLHGRGTVHRNNGLAASGKPWDYTIQQV